MDRYPDNIHSDQAMLSAFLADRDAACPVCRYNLRAVQGDRCPECGTHLQLQVGQAVVRYGAYLWLFALLAAPALGFIMGLPWTIRMVLDALDPNMTVNIPLYLWIIRGAGLVALPLFIITWLFRLQLVRMRNDIQWVLVIAPALYHLALLVWFTVEAINRP